MRLLALFSVALVFGSCNAVPPPGACGSMVCGSGQECRGNTCVDSLTANDAGPSTGQPDAGPPDAGPTRELGSFTVEPTSGLSTSEDGTSAVFTIRLNSKPSADVSVALVSSQPKEGRVSPGTLKFTPSNWALPQSVTVTGIDDGQADGPVDYEIITQPAISADSFYQGIDADNVQVTNVDNDTPGFLVTPTSGLQVTESGGTASFSVRLTTRPTANVSIQLSSTDTSEGIAQTDRLTFTPSNFALPQTVTVTGVNDAIVDGNIAFQIVLAPAESTDTTYDGLNPADVNVLCIDDEVAGFTLNPTSGLSTTEAGGTATFTVKLNTQPSANVILPLVSSDPSEGTVSPTSLTFTVSNWATEQTVTVRGVDDAQVDGNVSYVIVTSPAQSADLNYHQLNAPDVSLMNLDDDVAAPLDGGVPPSTDGGQGFCNASTCPLGCCNGNTCMPGTLNNSCGANGQACTQCTNNTSCLNQICASTAVSCNAQTCPSGCCSGNVCLNGTSNNHCGTGGQACDSCNTSANESCLNQTCTVQDAGMAPGTLGAACVQDSDCFAVGGNPPRCKRTTSQGNLTYTGGYCTRRCYEDSQCGANGMCVYALGPFGEAENICILKCDAQTPCPRTDGYICLNFGTESDPRSGCFIDDTASADPYARVDAGAPAGPGVTGSACTNNAQCQPPSSGFCITDDQGYPGGACTSDCSLSLDDNFCGTGGRCNQYLAELAAGEDPFVIGLCERGCNANAGSSTCRTGYACEPRTGGRDVCVPRCDLPNGGSSCTPGETCINGLCR